MNDIFETVNHFRCIDTIIQNANKPLSEKLIKQLHLQLKQGTDDAQYSWFRIGDYKIERNEVGNRETTAPDDVAKEMQSLLKDYNKKKAIKLEDIIEFHVRFERIHPFTDGNGRVGRLIMLKKCLKNNIVPFIIMDEYKMFYYRGLNEWDYQRGYLLDLCLSAQDEKMVNLFWDWI